MSVSLTILISLILSTAAIWVLTQNKRIKSILFPVNLLLLYLLFWKIAGPVFAHLFLFAGFLIVITILLLSPDAEPKKSLHLKFQFKYVLSLGTVALYTIVSLLVFIDAVRQSESLDLLTSLVSVEFLDFIWIYIIVSALFSIQLSLLLKGIFKTDE